MEYLIFTIIGSAVLLGIQWLVRRAQAKSFEREWKQFRFSNGLEIAESLKKADQ